ncbi:MAG: hypothetical protein J0L63_05375 [Anaerolineae bacterium]|nr:hypothetical protein [Anaerolineae bacterium]
MRIMILIVLSWSWWLMPLRVEAQESAYAASVEIVYEGVELRRAGTEAWLSLPVGAQAPLGEGDTLRTNSRGRALIRVDVRASSLLLSSSEYHVNTLRLDGDQRLVLEAELRDGRSVHRLELAQTVAMYRVILPRFSVEAAAGFFALDGDALGTNYVAVNGGDVSVTAGAEVIALAAGQGLRVGERAGQATALRSPMRFSLLDVQPDTCRGIVKATIPGEESVQVRVGPGEGYISLGLIPNDTSIPLLGLTADGYRYLTPFLSGYGWVVSNGVIPPNCDQLPVVEGSIQFVDSIVNVTPIELEYLLPFFGLPADDRWFYVSE